MSGAEFRVIVVGGAGSMGRWAVRALATLGAAKVLTIADIDFGRASLLAEQVGGACRPMALDARDPGALRAAFVKHDVVVNTMGPFALYMRPILVAAIQQGCHYLDINDDWQPTLDAFGYDAEARRRGLHVVIGLGGSPGVTNLCAALAADRLDHVEELHTGWKLSGATLVKDPGFPNPKASAAVEHWLHQCSQPAAAWVDGRASSVDPVAPVEFEFPGLGTVAGYTMGHPEPVTLPRTYPNLRSSLNLQAGPAWLFEHLRGIAHRHASGELTLQEGAELLAEPPQPTDAGSRSPLPIEWALAVGQKGGRRHRVAVYPKHYHQAKMGGNTGVPLAVGVELLRHGRLLDVGVHAPETAIEPRAFFDLLAPLIDQRFAGCEALIATVEMAS